MVWLTTYLLSCVGLTVLVVWPEKGPTAWVRDRVFRPILPGPAKGVLDCYVCLGFWTGLALSPVWSLFCQAAWCWFGCLMTPAVFWFILMLRPAESDSEG